MPAHPPAAACLSAADLAALGSGRLPPPALDAAAAHLADCPACSAALAALPPDDDPLVARLRGCADDVSEAARLADTEHLRPGETPPAGAPTPAGPKRTRFGPYALLEPLARGGMGVVYKALQLPINRVVALKMLRHGPLADAEAQLRFRAEGEAVARLDHPHIVRIFDFGEVNGEPYYSMEYVAGGSLAARLAAGPLPPSDAAQLVEMLARAVQYAHEQKVLHRDLKPANILLQRKSEIRSPKSEADLSDFELRISDFSPKVSDFGLAKLLDAPGDQTLADTVLGTPQYMAPEQARGALKAIGPATDVYGLGTILYECLTGRPPFTGESRSEIIDGVCTRDPEPPARKRPEVGRELEAVCLKCLEKEPARRYATAGELADDLDRWLRNEPTHARPEGRIARYIRRRSVLTATLLLAVVATTVGVAIPVWRDPERVVGRIEARLDAGRPVSLIGPTGGPSWGHWRLGGDKGQVSRADDGCFTAHTWGLALYELARDPRRPRYRLRADIRHQSGDQQCHVGLYVCHRETPLPDGGTAHTFVHMYYDDLHDIRHDSLAKPPSTGNSVFLAPNLYAVRGDGRLWAPRFFFHNPQLFRPAGFGGGVWRTLVLEVRSDGVCGWWGDKEQYVGEVGFGRAAERMERTFDREKVGRPVRQKSDQPDAWVGTGGGFGLYLVRSSASFRNLVVEPLADDE